MGQIPMNVRILSQLTILPRECDSSDVKFTSVHIYQDATSIHVMV